jgi:hypothetical protein
MQIKDLSVELTAEAQAAVHGGGDVNQANLAAQTVTGPVQLGNVGVGLLSPSTNSAAMLTTLDQSNAALNNEINDNDDFAAVANSIGVLIGQ